MPSMLSVAREANVAVSTVFLTLYHRDRVSPETRKRVEEAMRRVGYVPNKKSNNAAKQIVSLRVAFIYTLQSVSVGDDPTMSSYCRDIVAGIKDAVSGPSSSVTIIRGVEHVDQDVMVNEQLSASEFDGVILFGAEPRNGYLERLQQANVPLVVINRLPEHGRFSCVTLDYYGGAQLAIDHLVSMGHRKIAIGISEESEKWLLQELRDGAHDALKRHGLEPTLEAPNRVDLGAPEQVDRFCRKMRDKGATAVFTGDVLATRYVDRLVELGLRVPEDVSVMGFDNRGLATSGGLALSTIGYDRRRMGKMAVRTLEQLYRSRGKLRWSAQAIATYLVEGQTVGQAAGGGA